MYQYLILILLLSEKHNEVVTQFFISISSYVLRDVSQFNICSSEQIINIGFNIFVNFIILKFNVEDYYSVFVKHIKSFAIFIIFLNIKHKIIIIRFLNCTIRYFIYVNNYLGYLHFLFLKIL